MREGREQDGGGALTYLKSNREEHKGKTEGEWGYGMRVGRSEQINV